MEGQTEGMDKYIGEERLNYSNMSVHYKFKSALEYDTVTFDGLHISVKDLKKAILQQKKIGKTSDFDLQVTNAQTKETYTDENVLIPKNASLIIARVPLTQQQKKQWEKEKLAVSSKPGEITEQGTLSQVDISSLNLSEEEKIKTMITQSTSDYDPVNYVKVRGGNQVGTVPASYICFKCHQHGHWIKDCPSTIDSANMGMTDTIKKSTGIPKSFMIEVEGPQVPGARMTPSGVYAVPAIDHEVYKEKKIEKPPFLAEKEKPPPAPTIPEDLICGICKDLLQDAVMIPCCGISFCDECIRNVLVDSEESECPDCNEKNVSPDTLIPNRFLRNSVNTFKNKTGYVKAKPKLIQQRPPSPPRPSLPDFVPPPDYVDPTAVKDSQRTTNAGPSPVYQSSPANALHIHHSPFQNQTTPVYAERSPYGDASSLPDRETASVYSHQPPYGPNQYQNPPPPYQRPNYKQSGFVGPRHPGPGYNSDPYQSFNRSASNYSGGFIEPISNFPSSNPIRGHIDTRSEQKNREGKEMQKEITSQLTPKTDADFKGDVKLTPNSDECSKMSATQDNGPKENLTNNSETVEKDSNKLEKLKKVGIDIDDVSSVSSNASEEPPPPVENRRPNEGHPNPSQGPSYAIPSLFSGQHPVILPPPGSEPYPPPRPGDAFVHGGAGGERSGTPTVDERLEVPPIRPVYDPYRAPNYMVPGYDQHYGMTHPVPMSYDSNMMYDNRGYRGMLRGPRMHRGRYAMRQPPPPGSRPLTPPRNEEEAYLAFQRMLKEKEERDKRKNEKLKSRRSTSRSRSRSATRSRRSFSGARSRSRTRSRTPPRRTRSRSKKRSRTRSRSFVMSRSRSRSYSRSPLHERNYSPKKYYSPHRSPLRYDRYDSNYGQWSQDHRDYRRGRYRGRGRGRFYKNSPPRAHEHQSYNRPPKHGSRGENLKSITKHPPKQHVKKQFVNKAYSRYRDENYVSTSPRHYRSPSRYYDQRLSPRCSDYPRDSRERDYRSYERETDSAARDRNPRRRSHSNSLLRNQYDSERDRDKEKPRERDRDRENEYRRRSRSRRSRSRRYTPVRKLSQERSERSKDKSPERRKDWDKEKEESHRSRDRRSYENDKDKRIFSVERDRSKEFESKRHGRSRSRSRDKPRQEKDRSGSKDKKKRSLSLDKQKGKESVSRKHRSSSRRRSISRPKEEKVRSPTNSNSKDRHKKGSEGFEKEKEKRSISREREELKRSASREKGREQTRMLSPKVAIKEDEDKKEKKKDREKKKKKKEKETEEERAARKKKKKEKKEEKKRKQEMKNKVQENDKNEDRNSESKDFSAPEVSGSNNFITSFKAVQSEDEDDKSSPLRIEHQSKKEALDPVQKERKSQEDSGDASEKEFKKVGDDSGEGVDRERRKNLTVISEDNPEEMDVDGNLDDDNGELQIHASYESLIEENVDTQKKGILVSVPEISKWELDENQVSDSNQKTSTSDGKSPEHPAKVTREVIKRAENAIFKKAVNAIREPVKKSNDKDDKKDRKIILAPEKDRNRDYRMEPEGDKMKRMFLSREKDKFHHASVEMSRPKTEVKRTVNSLQITIPLNNDGESPEREFSVDEDGTKVKSQHKDKNSSRSPPPGRVPIKERLGSKIDKQGRHGSPHLLRTVEKRGWNDSEEQAKPSRKDYQRPTLSSTVESIDAKRSSIDEAHFVPNYDESSDEEENVKSHPSNEKEVKFGGSGDTKKRLRSSSESSEESTKKHKKKKSKSKKKKQKKSKKHMSDSSDSSDSEREKKKHKKSKKKKKSRH